MLIPSKYENINKNLLVLGAKIIQILKKSPYNIEVLFQKIKEESEISVEQYFDAITFLWLSDILITDNFQVSLNKGLK